MTIVDVVEEFDKFNRLIYVEFLEFLCRLAYLVTIPEKDVEKFLKNKDLL